MSESNPVQPLESQGGTDQRLQNMLGGAMQAGNLQTEESVAELQGRAVDASLCPNCKNGAGKEIELEDGKCPDCGFVTSARTL